MSEQKPIPLSKAKTAWGLVQDVKRAIQQEYRRANMGVYSCPVSVEQGYEPERIPACGTVGCFAGWVCLLAGLPVGSEDTPAKELLGEDLTYLFKGRSGFFHYFFNAGAGDACVTSLAGTKAHAAAVVRRIERFARLNEAALKARRLPVVRGGEIVRGKYR